MQLLISDANILIDLEEGKLLEELFTLPFQFSTPDIIFYEELEELHAHLPDMGLQLGSLTPESIDYLQTVVRKYSRPSRNDCMALVLAQQEQCPLVTGDKALRVSAKKEGVEIKGTLWLVEQLVQHKIISAEQAVSSYKLMYLNSRRLPFELAYRRLKELKTE